MMNNDEQDAFTEEWAWWQIVPAYIRGVLGWHSFAANRGMAFILEGFYIWLGKRLPAELVFRASNQLLEFADEKGLRTYDIVEAQSYWLTEKMK